MKLTIEKLKQIIAEEVKNVTEAPNYGDYDPGTGKRLPTDAQRRFRSAERNVGVADSERRAAARAARQISRDEKKVISGVIEQFLTDANDENARDEKGQLWWPETWLGGGRIWTGSDYVDRTPEQNDAMRKRFDDLRGASGRDPFTIDHIKQDIKQTGSSVWYFNPETRELKHPSLKSFIDNYLIKSIAAALKIGESDAKEKLKVYLASISEGESIHAPSPRPALPKERDEKKPRRKRDSRVDHSDKVTGNMTDFGRIAEKKTSTLTDIIREVLASYEK